MGETDEIFVEVDTATRLKMLAADKAARESEDLTDIMKKERSGLSEVEMAKITKLDETNNASYAYLRKHGNMWQYDPKGVHPKLKARLYRRFDTFDKDSDGTMTIGEVLFWADRMKSVCKCTDKEISDVRVALRTFFEAVGLTEEGLQRENFVEGNQVFYEAEKERKLHGEGSLVRLLGNAYFEILDEDDDGTVSLPELKNMMRVFRVPVEAAYTFFEVADTSGDGLLQREEMHELFCKFWLEDYDPQYDGIFAYKY